MFLCIQRKNVIALILHINKGKNSKTKLRQDENDGSSF